MLSAITFKPFPFYSLFSCRIGCMLLRKTAWNASDDYDSQFTYYSVIRLTAVDEQSAEHSINTTRLPAFAPIKLTLSSVRPIPTSLIASPPFARQIKRARHFPPSLEANQPRTNASNCVSSSSSVPNSLPSFRSPHQCLSLSLCSFFNLCAGRGMASAGNPGLG